MKTYLKFRFFSIIILIVGVVWIWLSRNPANDSLSNSLRAPQAGLYSPGFSLTTLDGSEVNFSDLTGSPVIINFWASWCPPCRAEMPDFQKAFVEFSETDLVITSINSTRQDSMQNILSFVKANRLTFPILLDTNGSVTSTFNIHSLPTTFFINRNGIITKVLIGGPIPLSLMRVEINKLLQE